MDHLNEKYLGELLNWNISEPPSWSLSENLWERTQDSAFNKFPSDYYTH